jgi:hypothetical protein
MDHHAQKIQNKNGLKKSIECITQQTHLWVVRPLGTTSRNGQGLKVVK